MNVMSTKTKDFDDGDRDDVDGGRACNDAHGDFCSGQRDILRIIRILKTNHVST